MTSNATEVLIDLHGDLLHLPLRARLTVMLRDAVRDGQLSPGTVLPSSRVLAADLGISRGVVVEAYGQLIAEGYLAGRQGAATTVAGMLGVSSRRVSRPEPPHGPETLDLRPGAPDLSAFPRRQWLKALRESVASIASSDLGYVEPWGPEAVRQELAEYLNRVRGAMAHADDVVLVSGATQAMAWLVRVLRDAGHDRVAVEDPGHVIQRELLGRWGVQVVDIPVDEQGVDVDALMNADVRALICTPAHQYPTGVQLSPARRRQLHTWATSCDGLVIEDDYDSEFRYDRAPIGCLQGLAPQRVALVGSVSKSLAPALRLGWVVVPEHLRNPLRAAKLSADLGGGALEQHALASMLRSGDYDRHLRLLRRRYSQRRQALIGALSSRLPDCTVMGAAGGLHLVAALPDTVDEQAVVRAAARNGVAVVGLSDMIGQRARPRPGLVLSYARATPDMLEEAVSRLAAATLGPEPHPSARNAAVGPGHALSWFPVAG